MPVKSRDDEQLCEVRSSKGTNRAAIGNLHESLRMLVGMIQTSGTARKATNKDVTKNSPEGKQSPKKSKGSEDDWSKKTSGDDWAELSSAKTGYEQEAQSGGAIDEDALQDELDALDFGNGDSSSDDDSVDLR